MFRALAGGCLVVALLALSACGGGGDSSGDQLPADDYRMQLDAACAEVQAANLQLPQIQSDQQLSIDDVKKLAEENGQKFEDELQALNPPDELADLHQQVLDQFENPPPDDDVDAFLAFQEKGAALYDEIGATGCADGIRKSSEALKEANETPPPTGPPDLGG